MTPSPKLHQRMGEVQLAVIVALIASTYTRILVSPPTHIVPPQVVELIRLHVIAGANILLLIAAFRCQGDLRSAVLGVAVGVVYGGLLLGILKWLDVDPLSFSTAANVVIDNLGAPLICVGGTAIIGFLAGHYHVTVAQK